jgi:hypothetical protein
MRMWTRSVLLLLVLFDATLGQPVYVSPGTESTCQGRSSNLLVGLGSPFTPGALPVKHVHVARHGNEPAAALDIYTPSAPGRYATVFFLPVTAPFLLSDVLP